MVKYDSFIFTFAEDLCNCSRVYPVISFLHNIQAIKFTACDFDWLLYIYIVFPYWCLKYWCGHNFCVFIFEMTSVRSFFKWCWLILLNLFTEMRGMVNNMVISLMNYIYVYLSFLYSYWLYMHHIKHTVHFF